MSEAKFVLSKSKLNEQVNLLEKEGFSISYSYKTNQDAGDLLKNNRESLDFSVHSIRELENLGASERAWFFTQANSQEEIESLFSRGVKNFVIDNEIDLENVLLAAKKYGKKANISIRMRFQEHRVGSGKYFVYGLPAKKANDILKDLNKREEVSELGIHLHRKSQNTSEWEIKEELEDSLEEEVLEILGNVNLGGGLPVKYRSHNLDVFQYIISKLKVAKEFLESYGIDVYLEPGRFLAAPPIKLETEIIQVQKNTLVLNTTIYKCALDTLITETKMLVENELSENEEGQNYLIKGNSPTRDDIFRYKVKLKNPKIGDKIVFLNAGAYNYTTDFFGYDKLKTEIVD
ncbi:MAG: decarboxylase [Candidatus Pacearchaeota archaeon]